MATKKKVTPKKSAPKKKVAPKKKATAKKSSAKKAAPKKQQVIQSKSIETSSSVNDNEDEDTTPSLPPVYTPTSSNDSEASDDSGSPMFKYLIFAAIILVGVIAYTMLKKKDTTPVTPEKLEETKMPDAKEAEPAKGDQESKTEEKSDDSVKPADDAGKEKAADKTATTPILKGYAVAQMVSDKTFAEAGEHCKSISMSLPSADQLRAIKPADVPAELKNSTVWTSNVVGSRNLKFVFSSGKALYANSGDKFQVLCKE